MITQRSGLRGLHAWTPPACVLRLLLCLLTAAFGTGPARAHDIPVDVRVIAFVKPAGDKLELLVRVPLSAMREVDLPLRGPGYLLVSLADQALRDAVKMWLVDTTDLRESGATLPAPQITHLRVSLSSDKSFASYETARVHVASPRLTDDLDLVWNQQLLDVVLEYPIKSDRSDFSIEMNISRLALRVHTVLHFLAPGSPERVYEFHGEGGRIQLDPRWHQSAGRFVVSGFWHILEGLDHLLFLACLVIPVRKLRPLLAMVTAFTAAHSITLIASALGWAPDALWFPPVVETLIALSVFAMALENIFGISMERRWIMAFGFGLIHGFGFSFALRETLQFAGNHLLTALLAFNIGVEIGQLAVLGVMLPALALLIRAGADERVVRLVLSVLIAHTAWHWTLDRGADAIKFPAPKLDTVLLAGLMKLGTLALLAGAIVWLARGAVERWIGAPEAPRR